MPIEEQEINERLLEVGWDTPPISMGVPVEDGENEWRYNSNVSIGMIPRMPFTDRIEGIRARYNNAMDVLHCTPSTSITIEDLVRLENHITGRDVANISFKQKKPMFPTVKSPEDIVTIVKKQYPNVLFDVIVIGFEKTNGSLGGNAEQFMGRNTKVKIDTCSGKWAFYSNDLGFYFMVDDLEFKDFPLNTKPSKQCPMNKDYSCDGNCEECE